MESFYAESTPDRLVRLPHLTKGKIMKEGIHPNYREVLFVDMSNGFKFVTRSCVSTKETENFEGKEYPLFKLDTTSESHPFYTGTQKSVDNMGGRVEKFRNRFGRSNSYFFAEKAARATVLPFSFWVPPHGIPMLLSSEHQAL